MWICGALRAFIIIFWALWSERDQWIRCFYWKLNISLLYDILDFNDFVHWYFWCMFALIFSVFNWYWNRLNQTLIWQLQIERKRTIVFFNLMNLGWVQCIYLRLYNNWNAFSNGVQKKLVPLDLSSDHRNLWRKKKTNEKQRAKSRQANESRVNAINNNFVNKHKQNWTEIKLKKSSSQHSPYIQRGKPNILDWIK